MYTTEAEMREILKQAKNLEMIETSFGNYTRQGWQMAENLPEKLERIKQFLEKKK